MGGNSTNRQTFINALAGAFGTDGSKFDDMIAELQTIAAGQSTNSPTSVFGEVLVTQPEPVFQTAFVASKKLPRMVENTASSGTIVHEDSLVKLATGTTIYGYAAIRTKKYLRYNPGKGSVGKVTGIFTGSAANSIQLAGLGTAEAGFYVGYDGTKFGIDVQTGGRLEIQVYEVNDKSVTAENITVTLNGTPFSVPVTDQTAGTASDTAAEMADFPSYTGWQVYAVGAKVFFHATSTGVKGGAFTVSGTTITGDFTQNQIGAANVHDWWYQDPAEGQTWNYNGGSGLGFTLDHTKGNIYRITFGYLGFDGILFEVKSPVTQTFVPIHYYDYLNANTIPNTQDPAMQGLLAVASLGSTTNLELHSGSIAGEIQGGVLINGDPFGISASQTAITANSSYYNVLTIRVNRTFGADSLHKINRGQIKLKSASVSIDAQKPGEIGIFVNADIAGSGNVWSPVNANEDSMCSYFDGKQIVTNGKEIDAGGLPKSGGLAFDLDILDEFLEAGDTVSIAVRVPLGGAAFDAVAAMNWKEDN